MCFPGRETQNTEALHPSLQKVTKHKCSFERLRVKIWLSLAIFCVSEFRLFRKTVSEFRFFAQAVSGSQLFCKALSVFLSVDKISADLSQGYLKMNLIVLMCFANITRVLNVNKRLNSICYVREISLSWKVSGWHSKILKARSLIQKLEKFSGLTRTRKWVTQSLEMNLPLIR